MEKPNLKITDNEASKQYEATVDGHKARIEYIKAQDVIYLTHTEVDPSLEGKGYASAMIGGVLKIVADDGWQLMPLCPFVAAYIKRHPEWRRILKPGVNV